ncbi:hypothetical protein BW897_15010 [Bacillus cereus]|uniref:Uncharacterized protein n=1 Tax=Bacillus cereus TaxID=1396 RepID=A0A1S9TPP8_BACCE|nr:Imm8 family immunity protein [Bacillus cereus]OOR11973.1 hypothetical protein BW897_15010 [Bacillus cereus]
MLTPKLFDLLILEEEWENEKGFKVTVEAYIGIMGKEDYEEIYTFYVVSPKYVETIVSRSSIEMGRGLIIIKDLNLQVIENQIIRLLPQCSGVTWEEIAKLLNRYGYGEYEDHPLEG